MKPRLTQEPVPGDMARLINSTAVVWKSPSLRDFTIIRMIGFVKNPYVTVIARAPYEGQTYVFVMGEFGLGWVLSKNVTKVYA